MSSDTLMMGLSIVMNSWLEVQLNVAPPSTSMSEVAFSWLEEASHLLAPEIRAELQDRPARRTISSAARPGDPFGVVTVVRWPADGGMPRTTDRNASGAGIEWLHKQLADLPRTASIWIGRYDDSGDRAAWAVELSVERLPQSPEWFWLKAYIPELDFTDPNTGPQTQQRYLDVVYRFADRLNPGYGQIGYRLDGGATAFEYCLRQDGVPEHWWARERSVSFSREALRGYSWLTIVPEQLVAKLGGLDSLRDSGAFASVRPLASGGAWLLATSDYRDFTDAELYKVFKVVAPVLRPHAPVNVPRMHGEAPLKVIFENPANIG